MANNKTQQNNRQPSTSSRSRMRSSTTTTKAPPPNWTKIAKAHGLKLELALIDNGNIVESVPVSWNQMNDLGLNLRPIERFMASHFPEAMETPGKRRVA
jgi:hypothetical protein